MHVLFLEIDTERDWAVASIGPAFLGSHLRAHGHRASMVRVAPDADLDALARDLKERGPDLLGVSLTSRQWLAGRRVVAHVRRALELPVVAGGLHPTFSPEATLAAEGFDFACLGEGEKPLLGLVDALSTGDFDAVRSGSIAGIQARGGRRPPLASPFEPIDELPFMARDLLDERWGVVHMTTQRGCPFPCTYCAARMYDELYARSGESYGRRRSHRSVLAELEQIRADGELNYVIFLDDTFTIHHPWVLGFCDRYREEIGVPFSIHARIETMNQRLIERLAAAGCRHVTFGVESGSERVRREVMDRPVSNQKIADVFAATRDAGMIVTANYMLGLPGETRADLEATIDLHHRIEPDDFGYFVFYPYPGTALFRVCRDRGYLPDDYLDRPANHRETVLDLPDLSSDDIAEFYRRWTEVRAAAVVARGGLTGSTKAEAIEAVERSAELG